MAGPRSGPAGHARRAVAPSNRIARK